MRVEVISAVPHSTVTCAALSRRANSVFLLDRPMKFFHWKTALNRFRAPPPSHRTLLKVVDVVSGRESRNLSGHSLPITSIAAGKSSVYSWYTGSLDCSWSQWDTRMHPSKVLSARTAGAVRSVALSPGDRFVAVGSDSSIQLFDARQRAYVKQFNYSGRKLEFNPTEVLLSAVGNDRVVRFFCLETFELVSQSDAFVDDVQASVFRL
ncbi:unnamed protein product [Caenorhabditis auriculariae]|uniref:Uncharacterized protein n=1 Tax=Caenorhabditis auriculariae TaxID=2777116 RepID=A0A8S1H0X9_9PELO|nr:unnamed protein product [Caenorhabditis auriculariae]